MIANTRLLLGLLLFSFSMFSFAAEPVTVKMTTTKGDIILELYPDKAPASVNNFVQYVESGFYKKTLFHRVIRGFMIQGGGYTSASDRKNTQAAIKNEADNGLKNNRGTIAMARTSNPHSATSQFFINLVNNDFLNHTRKTMNGWGYAVFGKVSKGMDVVDAIANVRTKPTGGQQNYPLEPIYIEDISIVQKDVQKKAETKAEANK